MITKVDNTISYLKNLWIETFINKTDKVTDITENSVLNATAFATAKVAQKTLKDVAIVEAQIFPETAASEYLDRAASLFGVTPRKGAIGSSTYIRVFANPGTVYAVGVNTFVSMNGIRFTIEEGLTVGSSGYGYIKVRSESIGSFTNVDANSIVVVNPSPNGHKECTNEYYAVGGRDEEDDEMFRIRILNHQNAYAEGTLEKFTQIFQNIDSRILRIMFVGITEDSFISIHVATQNGQELTVSELSKLKELATPYFGMGDMTVTGRLVGIKIMNASWFEVGGDGGVDFRCEIESGFDISMVRKNIQVGLTKYLDFRFWTPMKKVEWDNLLEIVKNTDGVKYVSSEYFLPSADYTVPEYMLPRIKKFIMRDLDGKVIFDSNNQFSPIFYPAL